MWRRLTGACQEPEHGRTGGRAEVGGRPGMQRHSLVAGVRLHMKKGDTHDAAAVLQTVSCCN